MPQHRHELTQVWECLQGLDHTDDALHVRGLEASPTNLPEDGGDINVDSIIFRRGEIADAEPAVPGWRMAVDDLFE